MNWFLKILTISAVGLACVDVASAQKIKETDLVFGGHAWYGADIERLRPEQKSFVYGTYEAAVGFQMDPRNGNYYDYAFGYPLVNVGLSVARMGDFRFNDHTEFPDLYSIFGSFERSLFRNEHFSIGYQLDFGLSANPAEYDPVNCPGNNWLSAPVMAYFGAGVFAKLHLGKRWELGADFMFRHYSNGRLALPNEALNALGGGVFARYRMSDYDYRRYAATVAKPDFEKGMQYMITLGGGVHTCMAEWNAYVENETDPGEKKKKAAALEAHPKLSVSFDAMYRYSPIYSTGLGVDVFYSSNMKELEASDRIVYGDESVDGCPGYSPVSVGIAVVQEVYWKNLAVHVALGVYPYRHKGVNGPEAQAMGDRERGWHYEKAGLRYYFPRLGDTFLGFAIKSHSIKAEYLEFSIGVRL